MREDRLASRMMSLWAAALLVTMLLVHSAAQESSPEIELKIFPSVIKLAPQEQREARVVVSNLASGQLEDMTMSSFTDADIYVAIKPPLVKSLRSKGTLAWTVRLVKPALGAAAGHVHFQLDYRTVTSAGESVPGTAIGTLEIQDRRLETIDKIAAARLETALDLIQEKRPGSLFLIVSNLSTDPFTIKRIQVHKPSFILVEKPRLDQEGVIQLPQPITVAPLASHTIPLVLTADSAVQPGKHMLLLEIDLEQRRYGFAWAETLIATHQFSVGVLGESEILTAIGVPSFLLLPGFLIVVAFRLMWTRVAPRRPLDLDPKAAEFWLIAILLSLCAASLYPLITGWFGPSRDYTEGYGLRDIVFVWVGSVLSGLSAWVFWVGGGELIAHVRARKVPLPTDGALLTLRKLARNRLSIALGRVELLIDNQRQVACVIKPAAVGQQEMWVAPRLVVTWRKPAGGDAEAQKLDQLKSQFAKLLDKPDDVDAIADFIERETQRSIKKVDWDPTDKLKGVMKVQVGEVKDLPGRLRIIRQEEES